MLSLFCIAMNSPTPRFPTTQWTRLEQERETPEGREWFCEQYRPAILAYLRTKMEHHAAEDLCQEFFASVVLKQNLLRTADRHRGRLRSLLLTVLDRFLINHQRKHRAAKRGGGVSHQSLDEPGIHGDMLPVADMGTVAPDHAFDRAWAIGLMERALAATEADCLRLNKLRVFDLLRPLLDGSGPVRSHAELARDLGCTARDVTLFLSRLRQRVANHLYEEVAATVQGKDSVLEEWESVRRTLQAM